VSASSQSQVDVTAPVSEREKWIAELGFREREILVREASHHLASQEYDLKTKEHLASRWRSPLIVAVLAASIAAIGNFVVSALNAKYQRQLEQEKAEQTRILEMIKTGDTEKAAENLTFLLESGLIENNIIRDKLEGYLSIRRPGSGPALPSTNIANIAGVQGADDARKVEDLIHADPIRTLSRSVGLINIQKNGRLLGVCSAFLLKNNLVLTAGHCVENLQKDHTAEATISMLAGGQERRYAVQLPPLKSNTVPNSYAILLALGNPNAKYGFLKLSNKAPKFGEKLILIMTRAGYKELLVVGDVEDCTIKKVEENIIIHKCDTGLGASGSPLLTRDGKTVLGLHIGRRPDGTAEATRADLIEKEINSLSTKQYLNK
jgi:V8-like Glu-specific endopeptidase